MTDAQALTTWCEIQRALRRRLGAAQGDLWITPTVLLRVMPDDTLLVGLPRKGKATWAAMQHRSQLQQEAKKKNVWVITCVIPDEYERAIAMERYGIRYLDEKGAITDDVSFVALHVHRADPLPGSSGTGDSIDDVGNYYGTGTGPFASENRP